MGGDMPWPQLPVGNKDHTEATVVIIGAGISGMCTAIDLIKRNNCRNFIILEKSGGVGGTWRDNRYVLSTFRAIYAICSAQKTHGPIVLNVTTIANIASCTDYVQISRVLL
jgi:heterodisulfide reductase subunit A-like polyferredoxin